MKGNPSQPLGFYLLFIHLTNIYLSSNYYVPDLSQALGKQ